MTKARYDKARDNERQVHCQVH